MGFWAADNTAEANEDDIKNDSPGEVGGGYVGYLGNDPDRHDVYRDGSLHSDPTVGTSGTAKDYNTYLANALDARKTDAPATDYSQGNQYVAQGLADRSGQADALSKLRMQATGNGPSAATLQAQQATNQNIAAQLGGIAGVAPGHSATAVQNAAGIGSTALSANIGQANAARSAELSAGQAGYLGGSQNMRAGDLSQAKALDTRSKYLSDLAMQQHQLNQQSSLAWEGLGQEALNDQLKGDVAAQQANVQRWQSKAKEDQANRDMWGRIGAGAAQTAAVIGGAALISDELSKINIRYEGR